MSGGVSISGLVSNLDTDSIVTQLVSAYSVKKDKYVKAQTKLEWKQDAWKDLNSKIYSFYSKSLSNLRFSSAFSKKASSVNSTKATVTASSDAVSGTQKLKINQLATSGYLTGAIVKRSDSTNTNKITGKTKLSDIGIEDGSSISITTGGKTTNITLNGSNTVNEAIVKLKDAGVSANFDETNQRFFVSSKSSGASGDFSIMSNNLSGMNALSNMGINVATDADVDQYRYWAKISDEEIEKLVDTDYAKKKAALYDLTDTKSMDKLKASLQKALDTANSDNETLNQSNTTIDYKLAAVTEVSGMTFEEKSGLLESTNNRLTELTEKGEEITEDEKKELEELKAKREVYVEACNDTFNADTYSETLKNEKTENNKIIENNTAIVNTNTTALSSDENFTSYVDGLNTEINTSNTTLRTSILNGYNTKRENAKEYVNAYDLVNDKSADTTTEAYKNAVAFLGNSVNLGEGAVRIAGQDAKIELNGATFTSSSNNFQVNGLTIAANQVTEEGEEVSITTDTDTKGIYDMIKTFFSDYNTLINEMDSLYNADSAKGYEPLTDDEKDAMTDTEVEKWEEKIKKALLRRDDTLQNVSDSIKNAFQKSFTINDTAYSLSSIGIKTGGYFSSGDNEKSMFHIDGDSDDSTSSGNKDKLLAAIASDPDTVCNFFNQLAQSAYTELSNKMQRTTLSSAYTVYNDKSMKNEYNEYSKTISTWEDKITAYEEKYRKQFTAMETALSKLNSNSSALSGLLGS